MIAVANAGERMQKNQEIKPKRGVIAVKLVEACLLGIG